MAFQQFDELHYSAFYSEVIDAARLPTSRNLLRATSRPQRFAAHCAVAFTESTVLCSFPHKGVQVVARFARTARSILHFDICSGRCRRSVAATTPWRNRFEIRKPGSHILTDTCELENRTVGAGAQGTTAAILLVQRATSQVAPRPLP